MDSRRKAAGAGAEERVRALVRFCYSPPRVPLPRWVRFLVALALLYTALRANAGARWMRVLRRGAGGHPSSTAAAPRAPVPPAALSATALALLSPEARAAHLSAHWSCPFERKRISCRMRDRVVDQLRSGFVRICLWDGNSDMHKDRISQHMPAVHYAWVRDCEPSHPDSLFAMGSYWPGWFIEQLTSYPRSESYKVLLATEPPCVQPEMYEKLRQLKGDYDLTLSLADEVVVNSTGGGNVVQWSFGSSHVQLDQWGAKPKEHLCSIIASKNDYAPGHKLRHLAIAMISARGFKCEALGRGYREVAADRKIDMLSPYMFSIVIENSISGKYMTEKLMDAIGQGTIPVYWGSRYAREVFGDGIIPFESLEELEAIMPTLSPELYKAMLPRALANMDIAKQWVPPERWLWHNVFECAYRWHAANGECRGDEEIAKELNG